MAFDEKAAKHEIAAYKAALVAFERALRGRLSDDAVQRLNGYVSTHITTWYLEDEAGERKPMNLRIKIEFIGEDL